MSEGNRVHKLEGSIFDYLTVLEYVGKSRYKCLCKCGNTKVVYSSDLINGKTKSCGCIKKSKELNLVNKRINMLTVIENVGKDENGNNMFKCKCDCGIEKVFLGKELNQGRIISCGNHFKDLISKSNIKHGMTNDRIYNTYRKMKTRCYNSNSKSFKDYGARGIAICDNWLGESGFVNFYNWSINNGYRDDLTIDRIDNNGNYEPNNCRWATSLEQQNNKRSNLYYTFKNETKTLKEWCDKLNLSYDAIWKRIYKYGYSFEKAVTYKIEKVIKL